MTNAELVAHFVTQREAARKDHDEGIKAFYCTDPIINTYRFCNVQREDDKVTRWLKKYWRDPYWQDSHFIPAMILARMVNWPPTLTEIGFPEVWDDDHIVQTIHSVQSRGKAWTGAYVITTCGARMDKALYVVQTASQALAMPPYHPRPENTLDGLWTSLRGLDGLGAGFLAAQVVADVKYTPLFKNAPDWWTFAVPGPGSRRGLNRYLDRELNASWPEQTWKGGLDRMIKEVTPLLPDLGPYHAQDWQNVMCEFDKWMRVRLGEGRPRSLYKPDTAYDI